MEDKNIFPSLEEITRMLCNKRFCLDNIDSCMACVKGFLVSDFPSGDLIDPPGSSALALATILSSDHD